MALNVGQDFKQRWLATPPAVRQLYLDDLARICELLEPETQRQTWLEKEHVVNQETEQRLVHAYAAHKAALIAAEKQRLQQAIEARIAANRAAHRQQLAELQQNELKQHEQQNQLLLLLRQQQQQALNTYIARYHKNPEQTYPYFNKAFKIPDSELINELDSVRLRLELEAEVFIEAQVAAFRQQLQQAAQEEIALALKNSPFTTSNPDSK